MTSSNEAKVGAAEFADVAQLVEHSLGKGEVISSILIIGSRDLVLFGWRKVFAESRRLIADGWFRAGVTQW